MAKLVEGIASFFGIKRKQSLDESLRSRGEDPEFFRRAGKYLDYRINLGRDPTAGEIAIFISKVGDYPGLADKIKGFNLVSSRYEALVVREKAGETLTEDEKFMVWGMGMVYSHRKKE